MATKIYFQPKRESQALTVQQVFDKGISLASAILISFKEAGEGFLRSLPSSYPSFRLMKELFGVRGYYVHRKITEPTIRSSLYRLKKQGLVFKDPKQKVYYLTEKGKKAASEVRSRYLGQVPERPWDNKFRIIVFDIPESKREWRSALRRELAFAKFHQLQKSVYIGKHPLPEDFYRTLENNNLLKYIFLLTVGDIDRPDFVLKLLNKQNSSL